MDAIHTSLQGIAAGFERFERAAQTIARNGAAGDLPDTTVDMMRARHQVRASAAALRTADGMIGSLLDILA